MDDIRKLEPESVIPQVSGKMLTAKPMDDIKELEPFFARFRGVGQFFRSRTVREDVVEQDHSAPTQRPFLGLWRYRGAKILHASWRGCRA